MIDLRLASTTSDDLKLDSGLTLILPSVSIGNVGQLAVDVLLSSLDKPEFVTSIYHPSIIPVVGSDPLNLKSDQLMTACQLYKTKTEAILQLRSGLVAGPQRDVFLDDLVNWIVSKKFSKVILLTSTEADERLDSQLRGSQFRFISKHFENDLKALEFLELEKRQDQDIFIPGSGFTKALYKKCLNEEIPAAIFMSFASEGNNSEDGISLAKYLNSWVQIIPGKFKIPPSWASFYGGPPPTAIYN